MSKNRKSTVIALVVLVIAVIAMVFVNGKDSSEKRTSSQNKEQLTAEAFEETKEEKESPLEKIKTAEENLTADIALYKDPSSDGNRNENKDSDKEQEKDIDRTENSKPENVVKPQQNHKPDNEEKPAPEKPLKPENHENNPEIKMDYETYNQLSAEEKQQFFKSFENEEDFFNWHKDAKAEYDKYIEENSTIINGDTVVDLGK